MKLFASLTICGLLAVAGCGSTPEAVVAAPPGMESAVGNIKSVGRELYTREGKLFGTVTDADLEHKFPTGEVKSGLRIRLANQEPNEPGFWMVREIVTANYYVKK